MAVVQRILQHLQASGVETVMYQSQGAANVDFDRRRPPFGYMVTVSRRKCDITRLMWRETCAVVVFFLDLAPLDYDGLAINRLQAELEKERKKKEPKTK